MGLLYMLRYTSHVYQSRKRALTVAEGRESVPELSICIVGGHKPATYDFSVIKDSK